MCWLSTFGCVRVRVRVQVCMHAKGLLRHMSVAGHEGTDTRVQARALDGGVP